MLGPCWSPDLIKQLFPQCLPAWLLSVIALVLSPGQPFKTYSGFAPCAFIQICISVHISLTVILLFLSCQYYYFCYLSLDIRKASSASLKAVVFWCQHETPLALLFDFSSSCIPLMYPFEHVFSCLRGYANLFQAFHFCHEKYTVFLFSLQLETPVYSKVAPSHLSQCSPVLPHIKMLPLQT